MEMEIYIDDIFESLNDGILTSNAEVKYIINYLNNKLNQFMEDMDE